MNAKQRVSLFCMRVLCVTCALLLGFAAFCDLRPTSFSTPQTTAQKHKPAIYACPPTHYLFRARTAFALPCNCWVSFHTRHPTLRHPTTLCSLLLLAWLCVCVFRLIAYCEKTAAEDPFHPKCEKPNPLKQKQGGVCVII